MAEANGQMRIKGKTGGGNTVFGVALVVASLLLLFGHNAALPLSTGAWIARLVYAFLFYTGLRQLGKGFATRRLHGRLLQLQSLFDADSRAPLSLAADTLGCSVSILVADVRAMQKKGMVKGLYADLLRGDLVYSGDKVFGVSPPRDETIRPAPVPDTGTVILREERRKSVAPLYMLGLAWVIYAIFFPMYHMMDYVLAAILSLLVFFTTAWSAPERVIIRQEVQLPPVQESTGNEALDEMLRGVQLHLADLRRLDAAIDGTLDAPVKDILSTTEQIVAQVRKHPRSAGEMRQFFNYTLPTTIGLLQNYDELSRQSVQGKNIADAMQKIEDMIGSIVGAFHRQLDALFADKALNIAVELEVMENMLGSAQTPDPFDKL